MQAARGDLSRDNDIKLAQVISGEQALDLFANQHFDFVFLDQNMPRMSGKEVARRIRAFERKNNMNPVVIVLMTGDKVGVDAKIATQSNGVNLFFRKTRLTELLRIKGLGAIENMALEDSMME